MKIDGTNYNPEAVKKQGKTAFVKAWKDRVEKPGDLYDEIVASLETKKKKKKEE